MDRFLSMMLIACDRRRNPVVGLASRQASQLRSSVVQLVQSAGALSVPTGDYTKKPIAMQGQTEKSAACTAITADGRFVSV